MKNGRIASAAILALSCNLLSIGIAAGDPAPNAVYVAHDGTRSEISTEERKFEFLKSNVPDGVKERKIVWENWERPYAHQKSIQIRGGFIVTSTLYMKNTIRIITVSKKDAEDVHRVIFYQDSSWSGGHIYADASTGGVKMAVDRDATSFVVISESGGEVKVILPKAQQDVAEQPATAGKSK